MADIRKRTGAKGTTYQVRYDDPSGSTGYTYKTFDTAKAARAFLEGPKPERTTAGGMTMMDAADIWLRVCQVEGRDGRPPVSDATYKYYAYIAEIIRAYPWPKALAKLTKPDIVAFRTWLFENYSRELTSKVLTYTYGVFAEMVTRDKIKHNPAVDVRVQLETRYSEPVAIPSEEEIAALLSAADRLANSRNEQTKKAWQRYRPMIYLAVESGMRPQEHVAIGGRDLDDHGVHVRRAIDRSGELSVTKTRAARRFIELSPETIEMVAHYRDKHAVKNDHDLVFPTESGHWQSLDNWRKRCFIPALEEAGLLDVKEVDGKTISVPRYAPYALRHYFASDLIAEGVDLARVQTLMGHTDISTTFDVYAHLIQRAEDKKKGRQGLISRMREKSCGESVASTN